MRPNVRIRMMTEPATARGEATRRKLLAAAEDEFGGKGFHAASISSITTRAGVGQGTFYLYYRSKEEVFLTVVREIGRHLRRHIRAAADGAADRQEAERLGLRAFLEFTHEHPGLLRIVQESQFVDAAVFREYYECLAQNYSDSLRNAGAHGAITPDDADTRAWAMMGIGHFLGMRWCLWEGQLPQDKVIEQAMQMVSHGIAAAI